MAYITDAMREYKKKHTINNVKKDKTILFANDANNQNMTEYQAYLKLHDELVLAIKSIEEAYGDVYDKCVEIDYLFKDLPDYNPDYMFDNLTDHTSHWGGDTSQIYNRLTPLTYNEFLQHKI